MWKTLEFWTRNAFECCKQSLKNYSNMNPIESNVESTVQCGDTVPDASEESKEFTSNSTLRDNSYDNLSKSLGTFHFCPQNSPVQRSYKEIQFSWRKCMLN